MNTLEFMTNKIEEKNNKQKNKNKKNIPVKDEMRMNTSEFTSNKIDEEKNRKIVDDNFNINDNFIILVKNNINQNKKNNFNTKSI